LRETASTRDNMGKAEVMFGNALQKYQTFNNPWGIAHSSLRLAQISALRGDFASLPATAAKVLEFETSHPSKRAGPGWRAFCASLTETDLAKRAALRNEARTAWTGIGALGLVRDYQLQDGVEALIGGILNHLDGRGLEQGAGAGMGAESAFRQ
jgi:hypothetical protein